MIRISRSALVSFSADQMFQLVNDVKAYSQFLPGCTGSDVVQSTADSVMASVVVSKAGFSKKFVTRNTLTENHRISMQLVEGPFRKLNGGWLFTPLGDKACKVELNLEFEFVNRLTEFAFGNIFKELAEGMVQAFTQRAKDLYHD